LAVCGTTSAVTAQQISELTERFNYDVIQLNPSMLADKRSKGKLREAVSSARSVLLKNNLILTTKSQQLGSDSLGQTDIQPTADSIARGLGELVAEVATGTRPGRLFLTGGDTADAVLTAVEAEGIRILGEVVAGVVQGVILGGSLDSLPLVTKAGAFGQSDTLVMVHEYWARS
jgi:uncharacterized protein YgbK (DUF1537 family)